MRARGTPRLLTLGVSMSVMLAAQAHAQVIKVSNSSDLASLSIEELGNVQVTSVSKHEQSVREAPSAVFVITRDDIARSGADTVPEILRMAPNLQVAQTGSSKYVITARGFSGNSQAQAFSNKLLVLIDGRTVYTPLYSGVYWDMQDVMSADVDRVEVISGPGATLWGANAVNGVINITTRKAADTQGGLVQASGGAFQKRISLRYGGQAGESLAWRAYVRALEDGAAKTSTGASARDGWARLQGGFRADWTASATDTLTLQGDAYDARISALGSPDEVIAGRNILARWTHAGGGGSDLQVQAYYDRTQRRTTQGAGAFWLDTYDADLQHSFQWGSRQQIVWGGGVRLSRYVIEGTANLFFVPPKRTLKLSNLFAQDTISLTETTRLTVGAKVEDGPYLGAEVLPSARLSWTPNEAAMLWAAVSRAIRAPTPFDRDVVEAIGTPFLIGDPDFQAEKLTAYELGGRFQPGSRTSISISTFYNSYDQLRSIENAPGGFLPLRWGNGMQGHTWGVEAWGEYRAAPWWRLVGGYRFFKSDLKFKPGASGLLGVQQAGDDPKHQASLRSSMDLPHGISLDADLRYVGVLPEPRVSAYVELGGKIAWDVNDRLQLSLVGTNLLHARHSEFPQSNEIPRSAVVALQWRF